MKFLNRLITMFDREDPFPKRQLRLQYVPSPQSMPVFAQQFVDLIRNNDKFQLDYSVESIRFVDAFLQRFRDAGIKANDFAETIFVAGAYVGQVMVIHKQAQWIPNTEPAYEGAGPSMMTVLLRSSDGTVGDVITRAFRRFHSGDKESMESFCTQLQTGGK